jgi:hypothetical protein
MVHLATHQDSAPRCAAIGQRWSSDHLRMTLNQRVLEGIGRDENDSHSRDPAQNAPAAPGSVLSRSGGSRLVAGSLRRLALIENRTRDRTVAERQVGVSWPLPGEPAPTPARTESRS